MSIFAQTIDMNRITPLILFLSTLLCTGCDMFEVHPYDGHITGERNLTEKNCQAIESKMAGKKEFRFAMISDTQRSYDDTQDVVSSINKRGDIDFVVHGGDQSDFGATKEFLWMRDIMNGFSMPWVCVIGNHDCLGTGKEVYEKVYGNTNFAFTAGNIRFICLNTNALEYDYSHPIPDFGFIKDELKNLSSDIDKTIFLMHVSPEQFVFNNNVSEVFQWYIKGFPNVQFCIYGHGHQLTVDDLFDDGIIYYQCPDIKKRIYLVFTIKEEGYDYEVVKF